MPDERPPFVPMPPVNSYWAREMEFNILNWTDGPEKSWTSMARKSSTPWQQR